MEKIVIIDTNSLIYRFYYALPFFNSSQGVPTSALYGLTNSLLKIIKEEKADYFIACFDSKVKTFRHKKDFLYKAQRPKIQEDLKVQINLAPKILSAFNIAILEKENYEADDLIGSLVKKNPDKFKVIYSGDLDLLQILDEGTILKFFKKGISEIEIYDNKKVKEKFGIYPEQLADLKALTGDVSDNIIGIKGIGKKTACDLLNKFNNLEEIIKAAKKKLLPIKLRELIIANEEKLILNKELATIVTDLNLQFELKKYPTLDTKKLIEILKEFDFYSIIERLNKANNQSLGEKKIEFNKQLLLTSTLNKVFCLINENKIHLFDNNKFCSFALEKSIFEKILSADEIIVFDLKLFIKKYYQFKKMDNLNDFKINKFFDLKIAFWLTKNITKPTIEKIANFYDFPTEQFLKFMPKIYEDLNSLIDNNQLRNIFFLDQKIALILAWMEINGLKIDKENLKKFKEKLLTEINDLKEEIFQLAGKRFNLNSDNELRKIIFEKLKLSAKNIKKTPKGSISVKESELIKIKDKHPFIEKYLKYRHQYKLLSSFLNNLLKYSQNGIILTNFEITGSATGRIISYSPNLQNIPPAVKTVFTPQRDYIFVSYDYSQIELRLLAHFSQDESLINIFYQDLDIHAIIAKILFKEENEKTRRLAKIINYGIIYGISASGIAQKTGLKLKESQEIIEDYFKIFPGIKKLINDLINKFNAFGYTETLLGRKRFFLEINSPKANSIAVNTPIQGTVADILKLALIDIFNYLTEHNLLEDVKLLLIIHDELIFEIKESKLKDIEIKIKQIMENAINLSVPLKVKIKKGYNLKDMK